MTATYADWVERAYRTGRDVVVIDFPPYPPTSAAPWFTPRRREEPSLWASVIAS